MKKLLVILSITTTLFAGLFVFNAVKVNKCEKQLIETKDALEDAYVENEFLRNTLQANLTVSSKNEDRINELEQAIYNMHNNKAYKVKVRSNKDNKYYTYEGKEKKSLFQNVKAKLFGKD